MFGNLLNQALKIIPKQTFIYYKFKKVEINNIGNKVNSYEQPITMQGSVQAISQDMYEKLGLDWSKKYISVHASIDVRNADNDQPAPDKIVWNNKEYLVTKQTNWYTQDGWNKVIAVEQSDEEQDPTPEPEPEESEQQEEQEQDVNS